jgi:hypothetical protein
MMRAYFVWSLTANGGAADILDEVFLKMGEITAQG